MVEEELFVIEICLLGSQRRYPANWGSPQTVCHRTYSDKVGTYLIFNDHKKAGEFGYNLNLFRCLQISEWFPEDLRNDLGSDKVISIAAIIVRHIQVTFSVFFLCV